MFASQQTSMTNNEGNSAGRAAVRGTLYGFILRIISFSLSQVTFRFVDPVVLGRASIRLELLLNTALFIGREGFRLALLKTDSKQMNEGEAGQKSNAQGIVNVSWLSIPVGGILSLIAFFVHMYSCYHMQSSMKENDSSSILDYQLAGTFYCIAAFIEILAEPLIIKAMQDLDVETRAAAEGTAALAKAATAVLLLNLSLVSEQWPVSAFGIAQMMYSLALACVMYKRKWKLITWPSLSTNDNDGNYLLDRQALKLTSIFTLQGIFKHLLTEGDRIILTALADGYDQGVYAMASSYGGMASRLLFQPLEENARLLFSNQEKLISIKTNKDKQNTETKLEEESSRALNDLEQSLCVLLKLVLYIGFLFSCIASNYTGILLTLLAGNKWGSNIEASRALSAFCIYTAFLALNGTTEAFVYGVAKSGREVGKLGVAHALGKYSLRFDMIFK